MKPDTEANAGEGISATNANWSFGGKTAEVFSKHVRRSVPMYVNGHDLVCQASDFFVKPDSLVYELGTSVGELLVKLAERHRHHAGCRFVGIDTEPDMVNRARKSTEQLANVSVEVADVISFDLEKADLIVAYYCIQFVPPRHRQDVIRKIYDALNWGGGFLWFEKVRGPDARFQDILTSMYTDFKLEQNYSAEEIIGKSRSLKGVLEPFSTQGNINLLARAGFVDVMTIFKYLCFEGFIAIK